MIDPITAESLSECLRLIAAYASRMRSRVTPDGADLLAGLDEEAAKARGIVATKVESWPGWDATETRAAALQEPAADVAARIEAAAVGADFEAERFAVEADQVQANDDVGDDDA